MPLQFSDSVMLVAEKDEPGAGWHVGGNVVEGGVGQVGHRNVAVENWLDGAVFADEERLDVAAIDDGDGAVWFVMDRYDGDVFASGDSGDEERIYRVECIDEGGTASYLGVHHALDDGGEQVCGYIPLPETRLRLATKPLSSSMGITL